MSSSSPAVVSAPVVQAESPDPQATMPEQLGPTMPVTWASRSDDVRPSEIAKFMPKEEESSPPLQLTDQGGEDLLLLAMNAKDPWKVRLPKEVSLEGVEHSPREGDTQRRSKGNDSPVPKSTTVATSALNEDKEPDIGAVPGTSAAAAAAATMIALNVHPWSLRFKDPRTEALYVVSRCWTIRTVTIGCLVVTVASAVATFTELHFLTLVLKRVFAASGGFICLVANLVFCQRHQSPPKSLPTERTSSLLSDEEHQFQNNHNKPLGAKSKSTGGENKVTQDPDDDGDAKDDLRRIGFHQPIQVASRHEIISIVLLLILLVTAFVFVLIDPNAWCQHIAVAHGGEPVSTCSQRLSFTSGVWLVYLPILSIRASTVCVLLLLFNILAGIGMLVADDLDAKYNISPVVPWMHWQVMAMWSFCVALGTVVRERFHRRGFIVWLLLLEKERHFAMQSRHYNETLRMLLSGSAVAKLTAGEIVEDFSEECTVTVCEVKDFARWSTSRLPQEAMEAVDILFSCIDNFVSIVKGRTTLTKAIMTGDCYVATAGLRVDEESTKAVAAQQAANAGVSRAEIATMDCCRFAARLVGLYPLAARYYFTLGVGIARGACYGSIMGPHVVRYNLGGPAFDEARFLARIAPPNSTIVNQEAISKLTLNNAGLMVVPAQIRVQDFLPTTSGDPVPRSSEGISNQETPNDETRPAVSAHKTLYQVVTYPHPYPIQDQAVPAAGATTLQLREETTGTKRRDATKSCEVRRLQQSFSRTEGHLPTFSSSEVEDDFWHTNSRAQNQEEECGSTVEGNGNSKCAKQNFERNAQLRRQVRSEFELEFLCSGILILIFFMVPIFQERLDNNLVVYHSLVSVSGLVAGVRAALIRKLPVKTTLMWIPYWLLLVQNVLLLASTILLGPSILGRSQLIVVIFMFTLILLSGPLVSWVHAIPMNLAHSFALVVVLMYSRFDGKFDIRLFSGSSWSFLGNLVVILGVYVLEQDRRVYYATEQVGRGMAKLLEENMESHKELLHKLVPDYVIKNVISKITLEAHCCVVQFIPDAVVLAMRIRPSRELAAVSGGSYLLHSSNGNTNSNSKQSSTTEIWSPNNSNSEVEEGTLVRSRSFNEAGRPATTSSNLHRSELEYDEILSPPEVLVSPPESSQSPAARVGIASAGGDNALLNTVKGRRYQMRDDGTDNGTLTIAQMFRAHFRAVETAVHNLDAEAAHCSLFHVIGDQVLIGGPLLDLEAAHAKLQHSQVKAQSRKLITFKEEAAARCGKMLVSALASLQETFGGNLTASLSHGSGYAAVLGEVLPSFDLLGSACRCAHEILDASPDGAIGCTEGFIKFIADCGASSLDWSAFGFEVPQQATSWRLRGAGQVRVVPLKRKVPNPKLEPVE